jgi:hypothetical protein
MKEVTRVEANGLYDFKKKVLNKGLSCQIDRIELASSCTEFYIDFLGLLSPKIFIGDGPLEATEILNHLLGSSFSERHTEIIEFASHSSSISIRKEIDRAVFEGAKSSKELLKEKLGQERFREVRNILFRDLNFQFSQSVYQVVERSFYLSLKREGRAINEFSAHPSFADRDWLNFHLGCSTVFETEQALSSSYSKLVNAGLFCGYFYKEFAVLVPLPECMSRNENLVLHHEEEAAVSWSDGTSLAYWNGVEVPLSLVCTPENVTAADIFSETNAEVRRCYQEKLGSEKFGNLLGLIDLDRKTDRFGNELVLYRTEKSDKMAGDFIYFAKVVCPSTGRNYFLCVPPGMSGVEEAVSWTFGKTPGDYRPSIET